MNDTTPTPWTEEVVLNFDHWSELVEFARQLERELTASRELCEQYKQVAKELADKCSNHTTACSWLDRAEGCDCEIKEIKAKLVALNKITLSPETPTNTSSTAH